MLNLYQLIISSDPGLIKFRRGLKSVLALLLTLFLIVSWVPPLGIFYACLAGVLAGLNHAGETLREQKISMLLAVVYFTAVIALGLCLQPYFWVANAVLLILSFLGFYLAKFGERYRGYPVIAAIFYLLSINFMVPGLLDKVLILIAVMLSGLCMFMVYFYFWPQQPQAELSYTIESLFSRYIACVQTLKKSLSSNKSKNHDKELKGLLDDLEAALNQESQLLDRSYMKDKKAILETLLVKQYALYSLLNMIATWLHELSLEKDSFKEQYQSLLDSIFSQLILSLGKLKQRCNQSTDSVLIDKAFFEAAEQFKRSVFAKDSVRGPALVYYSYLAFGFTRSIALLEFIESLIDQLGLKP